LFFNDLQNSFGSGCSDINVCKLSEATVIAHLVGHHVQDELGILPRVMQARQATASEAEVNRLQVRVELQADCLAGVWANRAQQKHNFLDPGDLDQALQIAFAIGDDLFQKQAQGSIVPDAISHGTPEQRKRWFMTGFKDGQAWASVARFAAASFWRLPRDVSPGRRRCVKWSTRFLAVPRPCLVILGIATRTAAGR
jgi:predicted metalloprotease